MVMMSVIGGRRRTALSCMCVIVVGTSVLAGCRREEVDGQSTGKPSVGVTTSYLECAVRDVAGDDLRIVRMLPPGGCPGHFDITPRMIDRLRKSAILFRFDFQESLDAKLERLKGPGLGVAAIPTRDGLCLPDSYGEICQAVREALSKRWPERASTYASALASARTMLDKLSDDCRAQVERAGLVGTKVLSSRRQEAFTRWLGLDVVGTYPRGEESRISQIVESLATGRKGHVKIVIANLQEGTRLAQNLADRLGARLVVFSNFPAMERGEETFDGLVRINVSRLVHVEGTTTSGSGKQ